MSEDEQKGREVLTELTWGQDIQRRMWNNSMVIGDREDVYSN